MIGWKLAENVLHQCGEEAFSDKLWATRFPITRDLHAKNGPSLVVISGGESYFKKIAAWITTEAFSLIGCWDPQ